MEALNYDEVAEICESAVHACEDHTYYHVQDNAATVRSYSALQMPFPPAGGPQSSNRAADCSEPAAISERNAKSGRGTSARESEATTADVASASWGGEVVRSEGRDRSVAHSSDSDEMQEGNPEDEVHFVEANGEQEAVALPRLLNARAANGMPPSGREPFKQDALPEWDRRYQIVVRRANADEFLGLDVKQAPNDCLQVVEISCDGAAAKAGAFKLGDLIQRVNGVGASCHRMVLECEMQANLTFDVVRPDTDDCGASVASAARSGGSQRSRPRVPPLKLS